MSCRIDDGMDGMDRTGRVCKMNGMDRTGRV